MKEKGVVYLGHFPFELLDYASMAGFRCGFTSGIGTQATLICLAHTTPWAIQGFKGI